MCDIFKVAAGTGNNLL